MMNKVLWYGCLVAALFAAEKPSAQPFYLGADLSYVNEMEDCGVTYREANVPKDVYQIFKDHGANLVRLRLWHTPSWYDTLNSGKRYSDLKDVKKAIARSKTAGMPVLLDFHLSDFWADPNRQLCPAAWLGVVDHLPLLEDSLYQYIASTLISLHAEGLLPEMVQIGNETNRGILLSPAVDAAGWSLDWNRNSRLFKKAIQAVRATEAQTGQSIQVALHIAGPADAAWLMQGFWNNGVTDFDVIGLSYYWAWHMPTSIADAASVVAQLKSQYPGKSVMIFETGYIWTNLSNDNAANIISQVHPDYSPASPENQRRWLVDMTRAVKEKGASGVVYWEPAWVSSPCFTPWGQGSHQEHAAFFDFENNLLSSGGIRWMDPAQYTSSSAREPQPEVLLQVITDTAARQVQIRLEGWTGPDTPTVQLVGADGKILKTAVFEDQLARFQMAGCKNGIYYAVVYDRGIAIGMRGFAW